MGTLGMGLALAAVVAAPAAVAAADLGSLLAPPPSVDWLEVTTPGPNILVGPFTADSYGAFSDAANGTHGTAKSTLQDYGFSVGFAAEWRQLASGDLLIERVFEFKDEAGASSWFGAIKQGTESSSSYVSPMSGASAIPDSFGAILDDGTHPRQWRLDFRKANLVFVVHTDSKKNDLAALAIGQARTEYGGAPSTATSLPTGSIRPAASLRTASYAVAAFVVVLLIAVVVFLVVAVRRASSRPVAVQSALQLSPDGAYWWDGVRWRSAASDIPPTAMRSPDGAYWWDGRSWRRVGT